MFGKQWSLVNQLNYDQDGEDDDDYVDPFNVDDGLLQDENEIEDFPDEDEEEEEARQVEETTVTPVTDDYDEGTYLWGCTLPCEKLVE